MYLGQMTAGLLVPAGVALAVLHAFGQTAPRVQIDIYSAALIEASKEMERQWGKVGRLESETPADYKPLLVYTDESVRADYPKVVGERQFEYLTAGEFLSRRKKAKKDFPVLIVSPATVDGGRIKVVVSQDWVSVRKRHLNLGISDWGTVFFRFDREKGEFMFDEVQLGGI